MVQRDLPLPAVPDILQGQNHSGFPSVEVTDSVAEGRVAEAAFAFLAAMAVSLATIAAIISMVFRGHLRVCISL